MLDLNKHPELNKAPEYTVGTGIWGYNEVVIHGKSVTPEAAKYALDLTRIYTIFTQQDRLTEEQKKEVMEIVEGNNSFTALLRGKIIAGAALEDAESRVESMADPDARWLQRIYNRKMIGEEAAQYEAALQVYAQGAEYNAMQR